LEHFVLEKLKDFARSKAAAHPGLFHPQEFPTGLFQEMREEGLFGAQDLVTTARGAEILAAETGSLGFSIAWMGQSLIPLMLEKYASLPGELKAGILNGSIIIALAISEPNAGAHPKYLKTTAEKIPGGWKLDGEKAYVTNGPIASHIAVLAVTGSTPEGRKSFSCFLVPENAKGITRLDHPQFDFLRPAPHCGFKLEGCEVCESDLLGTQDTAYEKIALPFRSLEDAVITGAVIAVLNRATMRTASVLGNSLSGEGAVLFGELAGIETALAALNRRLLLALRTWDTNTEIMALSLIAMYDLARRYVELLRTVTSDQDEHTTRILRDVDKFLNITWKARQSRKVRVGQQYFISTKDFSGLYEV
jgi:acyl-CoA dehydrogenase